MRATPKRIEAVARALCEHDQYDPAEKSPGQYTVPYDATWIGESNARCDGRGYPGQAKDDYKEPWCYLWRRYALKAMVAIRAMPE